MPDVMLGLLRLGDRLGPPGRHRLARSRPGCRRRRRPRRPWRGSGWHGARALGRLGARAGPRTERIEPWSRRPAPGRARPTRSRRRRRRAIGLRSTFTHRGYLDAVARVREYIVAGDIFQANLSQRFQAPLPEPPFELYRRLRRRNPAPFAAYLDFDDVTVLSASPERFLRLDQDGGRSRPGRSRAPAPAASARCTTRRSAARWRRARRIGPRT